MAGFYREFSNKYNYYAQPEGKDPLGKIFGLSKIGIVTSSFLSIYDACLLTKCQTVFQFLNTAGFYFVPITGMCLSYSTVTYTLTHLRGDDVWNGVIGACAAGGVLQSWLKQPVVSGWGTVFFVLYSVLRRDVEKNRDKYIQKHLFIREECPPRWFFSTRNDTRLREFFGGATFKHDRESYWRNFNIHSN